MIFPMRPGGCWQVNTALLLGNETLNTHRAPPKDGDNTPQQGGGRREREREREEEMEEG